MFAYITNNPIFAMSTSKQNNITTKQHVNKQTTKLQSNMST